MLSAASQKGSVIDHNLEKGLGNEQALRSILGTVLPRRLAVTKGKLINEHGDTSKQIDIIVYDALNCPVLFTDENANQILPIQGAYAAIEVKTTLDSTKLKDAFDNLFSVYRLADRKNLSTNDFVIMCPPFLKVFAFNSAMKLPTLLQHDIQLRDHFPVFVSTKHYSKRSPAFETRTGHHYMVDEICVFNEGQVYHSLGGHPMIGEYGKYALGMFITGIIEESGQLTPLNTDISSYMNWLMAEAWLGNVARRGLVNGSLVPMPPNTFDAQAPAIVRARAQRRYETLGW